ncbi:MAG TPA: single-stranded DNA-binding protein [Chlamydiales bacterium]|nr:single-stranded DNA-binding protein [Chlamydiales bacterium]
MNSLHIAGNLGADPEVRFTSSGQKVTTLRIAAKARRGGKDETIWWRVTVWGEQFDKLVSYLKKGSSVIVTGDMSKPEIYTDRSGNAQVSMNMTATNIMFSPFGRSDKQENSNTQSTSFSNPQGSENAYAQSASRMEFGASDTPMEAYPSDDEIPF